MNCLRLTRTVASAPRRGTVLALHGMMESGETLRPASEVWAADGWDVIAPDLRGHGGSPRWDPHDDRHPGDRLTDDVLDVLDEILDQPEATGPVVLFGHSAGGGIAAAVAAKRSERVHGVLLEDPFWRLPVTRHQDRRVARRAYAELLMRQALAFPELVEKGRRAHARWDPAELPAWARAQHDADSALVLDGDVIPSPPWPDILSALDVAGVPVLVITGTGAHVGMTHEHRRLLTHHGADLALVDGASHFVRRDDPTAFFELTGTFLAAMTT
ncbi:hypothetical protein GCM10023169_13820 [Georgenia halophila]|uniref:Serine aminopeptidase S33 domain-containing protein n=1 Tax=Georgenia halophila TaxID=620889 RepID=A0ABP8L2U6_9MICO